MIPDEQILIEKRFVRYDLKKLVVNNKTIKPSNLSSHKCF